LDFYRGVTSTVVVEELEPGVTAARLFIMTTPVIVSIRRIPARGKKT